MNPSDDELIDAMLRSQFDGPVLDEGFSRRVMQRLPQHRRRVAWWPVWGGLLAGAAACWLALLSSPLLQTGWREWVSGEWSAPAITVLLAMIDMALLALIWGVAEADHR